MTRPTTSASSPPGLVLGLAAAANFFTILDLWVVSIAYPAFESAFVPATLSDVSWILNAYAILLASLLVPAGRLADRVGAKALFLAGLSLFGLASLGCGLAPSLSTLIACRAVQGVAAAMLMPTSLGFALSAFPVEKRATAVGVWAAVGAVAASSGPPLGGLLMLLSWRWIFFINVPLVLAALIAASFYLPVTSERIRRRLDWLGALLVFGATGFVCTALVQADAWPFSRFASRLVLGLLLAAAFVAHVRRHPEPIVLPRLFALRRFRLGALGIFLYYVGFAAMLVGSTLLLTDCWHFSMLRAALAIAPGPCTASLVSPFAGRLSARFGFRKMVGCGALLFAVAGAWPLCLADAGPNYALAVLPSLLCWGLANALLQPTLFATADAAPSTELSSASAVLTMARQLGSALGVALLVAVLGSHHAPTLASLARVWTMVIVCALLTAAAGLRAKAELGPELRLAAKRTAAV